MGNLSGPAYRKLARLLNNSDADNPLSESMFVDKSEFDDERWEAWVPKDIGNSWRQLRSCSLVMLSLRRDTQQRMSCSLTKRRLRGCLYLRSMLGLPTTI